MSFTEERHRHSQTKSNLLPCLKRAITQFKCSLEVNKRENMDLQAAYKTNKGTESRDREGLE